MRCELIDLGLVDYAIANQAQFEQLNKVKAGLCEGAIILAEFTPVYTMGRRGSLSNLLVSGGFLEENGIKFCETNRGGDITAHNPGQLIIYPIFNLAGRKDLNWYLRSLEEAVINLLSGYNISSYRKNGFTGVWVNEGKIASIGISVSRWVAYHGISLNVNNDLSLFDYINPCGIKKCAVTSMSKLKGRLIDMPDLKRGLTGQFKNVFGVETYAGTAATSALA